MRLNIRIVDQNGNVIKEGFKNTRNIGHFNAQKTFKSTVYANKKAYNRARAKQASLKEVF